MIDDIPSLLAAAANDVEESGVPDDLRPSAFQAAVALRTTDAGERTAAPAADARGRADWHASVAAALDVSAADIEEAFDMDGERLRLTILPSRLPPQKAAATKDVALLISAARQAAGVDEDGWTPVDAIRSECREIGVLDANNFAADIQLPDLMSVRGRGRSRELKITRRGFEQAGIRLKDLVNA